MFVRHHVTSQTNSFFNKSFEILVSSAILWN